MDEKGDTVNLVLAFGAMRMTWTGAHFKAEWKQGDATFPLELKRVPAFPAKHRPQTPAARFPYADQTLSIAGADGVTLGATLSVPKGARKPNVVILVHGSGPATRDEEVEGQRTFAVLAEHLARNGIAVLRYDKRGISRSTGSYEHHTQVELAADLSAVVKALKARGQFGEEYGVIEETIAPAAFRKIADFARKQ